MDVRAPGEPPGREPRLPARTEPPTGLEPLLASRVRAADVLRVFRLPRDVASDCGDLTPPAWWGTSRRGDLMVSVLPAGRPGSDARRRLLLTACRFARLCQHRLPAAFGFPLKVLGLAEYYGRRVGALRLSVVNAACKELHTLSWRLADPTTGHAVNAICRAVEVACGEANASARRAAHEVVLALAGEADRRMTLGCCADIVREAYPDIGAVLSARQAEDARGWAAG